MPERSSPSVTAQRFLGLNLFLSVSKVRSFWAFCFARSSISVLVIQNRFTKASATCRIFPAVNKAIWILSAVFALTAGVTDLRWRRIPNWLTYPAIPEAIVLHAIAGGWPGAKLSLLGTALALGLLLPFVLIRSLGGGDWKLVGGMGAFFGTQRLISVLIITLLINGFIAICLVIWKRRLGQTLLNLGHLAAAFFSPHPPRHAPTIYDPAAPQDPFVGGPAPDGPL